MTKFNFAKKSIFMPKLHQRLFDSCISSAHTDTGQINEKISRLAIWKKHRTSNLRETFT